MFVSHDRYFIDKLATRVFEIGDGEWRFIRETTKTICGGKRRGGGCPTLDDVPARGRSGNGSQGGKGPPNEDETAERSSGIEEAKIKRLNPIKRKQMEEQIYEIEQDIARVETAIAHCETSLLTFVSAEETQQLNRELEARREELASLLAEWESLSQTLEAAN